MADIPPVGQGNVFQAYYGTLTPKKAVIIASGLLAFTITYIFRRDVYHESYQHLPPSSMRLGTAGKASISLSLEAAFVGLVTSAVVYWLISTFNNRIERPHQA